MGEYLVDKRDLEFVLFEHMKIGDLGDLPKYADFTQEDFELILGEAIKVATDLIGPLNTVGDRTGTKLVDGEVVLPEGWTDAYKRFSQAGWVSPSGDPGFGGQGLPFSLGAAITELFFGANASFMFFPGLTASAAHVIHEFGTDAQRALYMERMYSGTWTGTMCLTEPQAGTDVGAATTSATEVEGSAHFLIRGNKLFISAGDGPMGENIVHLVLARVPGDPPGTKGLSLFIVPKFRHDENGNITGSNNVVTTAVEHKMGINASPTCALSFGDDGDTHGYLLGERRQGIVAMFKMMNEARISCGIQGAAIGNVSYQHALRYARERVQSAKATDRSPDAAGVPIIEHPDVRRNLLTMKSLSEGLRALLLQAAYWFDQSVNSADEADATRYRDLVELLTPICKAYATDQGFRITELGVQIFGGYGYIREYPQEQYMRDIKIASLYEGTNGIQALDLLGRKMRLKGGALFMNWLQVANGSLEKLKDHEGLGDLVTEVEKAKNALAEVVFTLPALGKQDPELFILQATPFLEMFGHVEVGRQLMLQAVLAWDKLEAIYAKAGADDDEAKRQLLHADPDARFYQGKVESARFFAHEYVPRALRIARGIKAADRSPLDIVF